jgi:hypothetical protein
MSAKGVNLKGVAINLIGQFPDEFDDAVRIVQYMRELLEWKHKRQMPAVSSPETDGESDTGNGANGTGDSFEKKPENQSSGGSECLSGTKVVRLTRTDAAGIPRA